MSKDKILLIDGNSIMNRAFYGIMGRNILQTPDRYLYKCNLWFLTNSI